MKAVSVIIPNYNNAHYLANAIQSIFRQTFTDYQIIVVDDGSTDNSKDVVTSFGDKVRYIWQENKGLGGARNTGILASDTEFIGLLDADDQWRPTYLETMMTLAQRRPDAAVYFSGAQGMDSDGNDLPQIFGRMISSNELYHALLRANFIIPSTVVFRRKVIVDAGLFEEKNRQLHGCEDWDLWLRLAPSHPFARTAEPLVRYRLHTQTFSANPGHMQDAVKVVIEKNFGANDGKYAAWSVEKKRAYGGLYRYQVITSIQRQENWAKSRMYLAKALMVDPSLATDLDMFYDLALGSQPSGYRGTHHQIDLDRTILEIKKLLDGVFSDPLLKGQSALSTQTFSTAYHALGLVAYNLDKRPLSRILFLQALKYSPRLIVNLKLTGLVFKSFLSKSFLMELKKGFG